MQFQSLFKHPQHLFKNEISFKSHVISILTNQIAQNPQILWENVRFHQKIFPFK